MQVGLIYRSCLVRASLAELIKHFGFDVCFQVPEISELELTELPIDTDIVLFELKDVDGSNDAAAVAQLKALLPASKVVLFGNPTCTRDQLEDALNAGGDGFITSDASAEAMEKYLRLVDSDISAIAAPVTMFTGPRLPTQPKEAPPCHILSTREMHVLSCVAKGSSNKVVARALDISESTVKAHLKSILKKIGVQNRTQAAIWAISNGVAEHS